VHCTKVSPEFEFGVKGQRSRSSGMKSDKVWNFFLERSSGGLAFGVCLGNHL